MRSEQALTPGFSSSRQRERGQSACPWELGRGARGGATPGPPRMSPVNPALVTPNPQGWGWVGFDSAHHGQRDRHEDSRSHQEYHHPALRGRNAGPDDTRDRRDLLRTAPGAWIAPGVPWIAVDNRRHTDARLRLHHRSTATLVHLTPATSLTFDDFLLPPTP